MIIAYKHRLRLHKFLDSLNLNFDTHAVFFFLKKWFFYCVYMSFFDLTRPKTNMNSVAMTYMYFRIWHKKHTSQLIFPKNSRISLFNDNFLRLKQITIFDKIFLMYVFNFNTWRNISYIIC